MRIDPIDNDVFHKQSQRQYKRKVENVTRIIALIVAFLSTFTFIIKIVFL